MHDGAHPARYFHATPDSRIQCDVCPRDCRLKDGQRGLCFVRKRVGDEMVLTTYGRSSGFCVDPIEKKPLAHFYPGSSVLSFGTAGCNLACKFCQNWDISKSREMDSLAARATPKRIAESAREHGCKSVAFTYNDPAIFIEYAMDVADACHELGIQTVAVTAGYMHDQARRDFFGKVDAANIDLKAFTESFYKELTAASLAPVLETLEYLVRETNTWTEITTLLIPGHNDSDDELRRMCEWVRDHLGDSVPLHFSAFHPDYRMRDVPPTPPATLRRARQLAIDVGLKYVYTGNVHDVDGDTTKCPSCKHPVIVRDWYQLLEYSVVSRDDADGTITEGRCPKCHAIIAGRFDEKPGGFGRRRMPVLMD